MPFNHVQEMIVVCITSVNPCDPKAKETSYPIRIHPTEPMGNVSLGILDDRGEIPQMRKTGDKKSEEKIQSKEKDIVLIHLSMPLTWFTMTALRGAYPCGSHGGHRFTRGTRQSECICTTVLLIWSHISPQTGT